MGELVKTADGVPETSGSFGGGELLDEIGTQRFVLTVRSVARAEKDVCQIHLANALLNSVPSHEVRKL